MRELPEGEFWSIAQGGEEHLAYLTENRLYWRNLISGYPVHDWSEINKVKHYPNPHSVESREWWERVEEIDVEFEKEHPPEKETRISAGWLAPNGDFYPCHYREHLDLAYRLSIVLYDDPNEERSLEERGWIKIYTEGMVCFGSQETATQKQLDTLGDLFVLAKEQDFEEYAKEIQDAINFYTR